MYFPALRYTINNVKTFLYLMWRIKITNELLGSRDPDGCYGVRMPRKLLYITVGKYAGGIFIEVCDEALRGLRGALSIIKMLETIKSSQ